MSSKQRRPAEDALNSDYNPRPSKRQRTSDSPCNPDNNILSSPLTELASSQSIPLPTSAPSSPSRLPPSSLTPIPAPHLLVNLPRLLIHPPNHPYHVQSLYLSLIALRKCLDLPHIQPGTSLTADIECRAWTGIAEVGMRVIGGGLSQVKELGWARGIEAEVEKAVSKGLHIANSHPSLRLYRPHLTIISATLAAWQHNVKYARNLVKKLLGTFSTSQGEVAWPPHCVYGAHLAYIDLLIHIPNSGAKSNDKSTYSDANTSKQDTYTALSAIQALADLAASNSKPPSSPFIPVPHSLNSHLPLSTSCHANASQDSSSCPPKSQPSAAMLKPTHDQEEGNVTLKTLDGHTRVVLLTHVLRLRVLVAAGMWSEVGDALNDAEQALNIACDPSSPSNPSQSTTTTASTTNSKKEYQDATPKASKINPPPDVNANGNTPTKCTIDTIDMDDPFLVSLVIHTLIIGVLYYTYSGDAKKGYARLTVLHATMDKAMLETGEGEGKEDGVIEISFDSHYSKLYIRTTHPRVLYALGFLVSSTAKRDPIGRKPKRKVFAVEGLARWDREMRTGEFGRSVQLPLYANLDDLMQVELRMVKIKADLLSELVGVSILRGEFDAAEHNLNLLIAHTRTYDLFPAYAARITLHHAHLAHALGQAERAGKCYEVAHYLASGGDVSDTSPSFSSMARVMDNGKMKTPTPSPMKKGSGKAGQVDITGGGAGGRCVLGGDSDFVRVAALVGKVGLAIGLKVTEIWMSEDGDGDDLEEGEVGGVISSEGEGVVNDEEPTWRRELERLGKEVVAESKGMGGTLEAIGQVLEACLSKEIIKAKQHLKQALSKATRAQDNHLRALILALISAHYFHVSADHAKTMLVTCDQLAAGLGAASVKPNPTKVGAGGNSNSVDGRKPVDASEEIGNAPLRLWVGEKFVELYKRMGQEELAKKQSQLNVRLTKAVRELAARGEIRKS